MIVFLVGNRPQFIKLSPVLRYVENILHKRAFVIHSGQHYDENMSSIFFEQLKIRKPDLNFTLMGSNPTEVFCEMLVQLEETLKNLNPSSVVVFGDTNTTLAGALATSKLQFPLVHIEAGPRTGNKSPEEINRKIVDHISDLLFCTDEISLKNLERENLGDKAILSGDLMLDAFQSIKPENVTDNDFTLLTVHRAINTDTREPILRLVELTKMWPNRIRFPIHPRTKSAIKREGKWDEISSIEHLEIQEPQGYYEMMALLSRAKNVLTDSGGLQKEASFAKRPCLVLDDTTPWPFLETAGQLNVLGSLGKISVTNSVACVERFIYPKENVSFFGNGNAAKIIAESLVECGLL